MTNPLQRAALTRQVSEQADATNTAKQQAPHYVVGDEHTLGVAHANGCVDVLRASTLRGAVFEVHPSPKLASTFRTPRPATEQDFKVYRVCIPPDFLAQEARCH